MVPYSASLDVSHELVEHVAWLLHARRQEINSRWRRLGCFKQALLALAHLRKNETFAQCRVWPQEIADRRVSGEA